MICTADTGFGPIQYDDAAVITIEGGLLGFPDDTQFVLLEHGDGDTLGYLQSLTTPTLAFPVMDPAFLAPEYPQPGPVVLAEIAELGTEQVGMLVVVYGDGNGGQLHANLASPIVIDILARRGKQVLLDANVFSNHFPVGATSHVTSPPPNASKQSAA
ncbi:MAG: flagellar assembly protein FliW [Myxococcales bacterium]|nr:flagellar assembly protein FliW [Myxococcales bacterium]